MGLIIPKNLLKKIETISVKKMITLPKIFNVLSYTLFKYQSVRNLRCRKPMWMPRAKTKMFKVPPRPVIPLEEELELRRLHNNYRTHVRSIRKFLEINWKEKTEETIDHAALKRKFEEDLQRTLLLNREWTEQLKPEREKFHADQLKMHLDAALEKMDKVKLQRETENEKVEELVRQVKEDSKNFITQENINDVLDGIIDIKTDYNYALNSKGEKIK